jgi:hypothetical protein
MMHPTVLAMVLLPIAVGAAECVPPTDYPDMVDVEDALASPAKPGAKASIFGYFVCIGVGSCRLLASPKRLYPHLLFDPSTLKTSDRERLMHCLDQGLTEPCMCSTACTAAA